MLLSIARYTLLDTLSTSSMKETLCMASKLMWRTSTLDFSALGHCRRRENMSDDVNIRILSRMGHRNFVIYSRSHVVLEFNIWEDVFEDLCLQNSPETRRGKIKALYTSTWTSML